MIDVIDSHAHVISRDHQRYPTAPIAGLRSDWSKERSNEIDGFIAAMDAAGVSKAVLAQSATTYGFDNSYVADSVERFPERLTGVCSVDIFASNAAPCLAEWHRRGCTGMRIFLFGSTIRTPLHALDAPETFPAWRAAAQLRMPVVTNIAGSGQTGAEIANMLTQFPDVMLVLDHLGRPDATGGAPFASSSELFALARFPNLFLKATPLAFDIIRRGGAEPREFLSRLVAEYGADRIAWGSNYPSSVESLEVLVEQAREVVGDLTVEQQNWILNGTAQRLHPVLRD